VTWHISSHHSFKISNLLKLLFFLDEFFCTLFSFLFSEPGVGLNEITHHFVKRQNGAFLSKEKTRLQHIAAE
jgi:hypothetical protein